MIINGKMSLRSTFTLPFNIFDELVRFPIRSVSLTNPLRTACSIWKTCNLVQTTTSGHTLRGVNVGSLWSFRGARIFAAHPTSLCEHWSLSDYSYSWSNNCVWQIKFHIVHSCTCDTYANTHILYKYSRVHRICFIFHNLRRSTTDTDTETFNCVATSLDRNLASRGWTEC